MKGNNENIVGQLTSIRRLLWVILGVVLVSTVFDRTSIGAPDTRALFGLACLGILVVSGICGVVALIRWGRMPDEKDGDTDNAADRSQEERSHSSPPNES